MNSFPSVLTKSEGFWAHLAHMAVAIWHGIVQVDADVEAVDAAHPEVVAAAATVVSMTPPHVRAGIDVAVELAKLVNTFINHLKHTSP
jgi:hypothetical protein